MLIAVLADADVTFPIVKLFCDISNLPLLKEL